MHILSNKRVEITLPLNKRSNLCVLERVGKQSKKHLRKTDQQNPGKLRWPVFHFVMCLLTRNILAKNKWIFFKFFTTFQNSHRRLFPVDLHWLPCSVSSLRRSHKFNLGSHQWHYTCVSLNTFHYQDSHIFSFLWQPTLQKPLGLFVDDDQMFDVRDRMFDSLLSSWYTTTRST